MKRLVLILAVAGLCSFITGQYTKTKVKNVVFDLPNEMEELNKEAVIIKYGMHKVPWGVYTEHTGDVMFSVNMTQDTIKYKGRKGIVGKDPRFEKMFMKVSVMNTYQDVKWHMDSLMLVDDKPMIAFEFNGTLEGQDAKGRPTKTRNYNFIQYCYIKNKKYIFNFSCSEADIEKWQPMARHMMSTLKIN